MEVQIGDRTARIELLEKEGNIVKMCVDDVVYDIDVVMAENGICSIIYNGKSYNAELARADDGRHYTVNAELNTFPIEFIDPQTKYQRSHRKDDTDEAQDNITSKMPGKVVKILVEEGEEVKAGQAAVIVEAMKMQNEYKIHKDCTIDRILVKEGDKTVANQTLIVLK